jgi:heme A synthase
MLVPAVGAIIWFGLIPVKDPRGKQDGNSVLWTFVVHPLMMTFLSYLLVSLFHTALDSNRPSRPILTYFHILVINYIFQVRSRCGGCAVPVRLY